MIRSAKITNKYANKIKKEMLKMFVKEYSEVTKNIIEYIWNNGYTNKNKTRFNPKKRQFELEGNLDNNFLKQFDNGMFTQRMLQACGTQASGILRACTIKNKQRQFMISELMKNNQSASKLQSITNKENISIPKLNLIQPQLDSRFFDISESTGKFDGFVQLRLFKKNTIRIPFRKYKKYNDYESKGRILSSLRISEEYISISFELPEKEKKTHGIKLGADQGILTCLTLSDGQTTQKNNHGHDLQSILTVLHRKKKGSKGFFRTQKHRENYINWSLNTLNLSNVFTLNLEKLFQLGKGHSTSRFLQSFSYPLIKKKLHSLSETEGFVIQEIGNQFRSQRCSECGWTQKSSRKGKVFECKVCRFTTDSDLNASLNLLEDRLPPIPIWVREEKRNRSGFLWNLSGIFDSSGEFIVPHVQKT